MKHNVIFIIALLLTWAGMLRAADEGDRVYALPTMATADGQGMLHLMLQGDESYAANGHNYRSLQFDLVLPVGITLKESEQEGEYLYEMGDLFSMGTNVSITYHADSNRYRFIVYNLLGTRFTGHSGHLLTLQLEVAATVAHAAQLEGSVERQVLGLSGDSNVHPEDNTFAITTGGDRAKGVYGIPFKTSDTGRDSGGSYQGFILFLDETEAIANDHHAYRSVQFDLHLPQGMHLHRNASTEDEVYTTSFVLSHNKNHTATVRYHEDGDFYRVLIYSLTGVNFGYAHSATAAKDTTFLWAPEITLDETFVAGNYTIRIDNQILGIDADKNVSADPSEIGVTHDIKLTYDDQRTKAQGIFNFPVAVDLNVAMTAGEWRTFSLPMSLTEAQVKEAFGEDVKLAKPEVTTISSLTGNTQLALHFQTCDVSEGMESMKPYLICPSMDISSAHFDNVIVKNTYVKGDAATVLALEESPTATQGAMIGLYLYAETQARYQNIVGTSNPNFLMVDGEKFYSNNVNNDPVVPMNAFRCIFYHRAINNLLKDLADVGFIEPTGEFTIVLENGQRKVVQGALVTENGVEYIAVGKTRYEVLSKPTKRGDINNDGRVDVADITTLVNYLRGIGDDNDDLIADFDGDMDVNDDDLPLLVDCVLSENEGGSQPGIFVVRNVSPVVGYVDGEEVFTWGGAAVAPQE